MGVGIVSDTQLPTVGNSRISGNTIDASVAAMLQERLPAGWAASIEPPPKAAPFDGVLNIRRDARDGTIRVGVRSRVEPKDVDYLAATLRPTPDEPALIAAPHLSPRTQARLRGLGLRHSAVGLRAGPWAVGYSMEAQGSRLRAQGSESTLHLEMAVREAPRSSARAG